MNAIQFLNANSEVFVAVESRGRGLTSILIGQFHSAQQLGNWPCL